MLQFIILYFWSWNNKAYLIIKDKTVFFFLVMTIAHRSGSVPRSDRSRRDSGRKHQTRFCEHLPIL